MSESEKLQQTIAEFESEVAGLTADVADLEQRLVVATSEAEQAIALAERRADDDAQAAAVDAEQARLALATALNRKRLALVAANADLAAARQGLAAAKRGALFIQLQAALDEISALAEQIDLAPMEAGLWAGLHTATAAANSLFFQAGGRGQWIEQPIAVRGRLWGAHAVVVDWTMGSQAQAPVPIPTMATLLGLPRAAGLINEMMGN